MCRVWVHVSVCVSVCLSASISPEPHSRSLPNFCACCLLASSSSVGVTKSRREAAILGVFQLIMHCMGRIAVWISLRRKDLAKIYLLIVKSNKIQLPIIKRHNCDYLAKLLAN